MKKIVILQHEPLTPNIEKKFCLKEIMAAGFPLEYWDISQVIYPGLTVADKLEYSYLKVLRTFDELASLWHSLPDECIAVPEFFFIPKTGKIWKLLRTRKIPLIKIDRYANTYANNIVDGTFFKKVISLISQARAFRYFGHTLFRVFMRFSGITDENRYDYYLTSGTKKNCDQQINHPDYDDYLLHKDDEPYIKEKYICFVDTGFGVHPDEKFFLTDINGDNKLWQEKLSAFFSVIEKKYGMPVVIAVHPKIDYTEDSFGGRRKIKYQTLNLVLNAEFVLQDTSNSLAFSVIAKKKLALITTTEFWNCYNQYLTQISKAVGVPILNIDEGKIDGFEPFELNESNRMSYMNDYLCSEATKDRLSSDLIVEFLKKL